VTWGAALGGPLQAEGIWVEVGRVPFTWCLADTILAPSGGLLCESTGGHGEGRLGCQWGGSSDLSFRKTTPDRAGSRAHHSGKGGVNRPTPGIEGKGDLVGRDRNQRGKGCSFFEAWVAKRRSGAS